MTNQEAMDKMGIDRKLGESTRDALDRFAKDQAKTETERAKEEADAGGGGGGGGVGGGDGGVGDLTTVVNRIETILKHSLPISAMV